MSLNAQLSFLLLGVAWGAQILLRPLFVRHIRTFFFIVLAIILGVTAYWVYLQYNMWASSPFGDSFGKFFLPPYTPISYFITYTFSRIIGQWIVAVVASGLFALLAYRLNKKFGERFFELEEPWLFALGTFLSGYPGFFFYIGGVLLYGLCGAIYAACTTHERMSLYHAWLPAGLFAILVVQIIPHDVVALFRF